MTDPDRRDVERAKETWAIRLSLSNFCPHHKGPPGTFLLVRDCDECFGGILSSASAEAAAENVKLREALRPFAEAGRVYDEHALKNIWTIDPSRQLLWKDLADIGLRLELGDLYRARAALPPEGGSEGK